MFIVRMGVNKPLISETFPVKTKSLNTTTYRIPDSVEYIGSKDLLAAIDFALKNMYI